jgi:hypothetical protein
VKEALKSLHLLLEKSALELDHPKNIALEQAKYHFYLLAQCCLAFEQAPIDTFSLSFYLRKGIFSLNRAVEELLCVAYIGKFGHEYTEASEHQLDTLYGLIEDHPNSIDLKLLGTTFKKANFISRYPFEYLESVSPLHDLILQAEWLKEHPELAEGFKTVDRVSPFNFIPVNLEGLQPHAILAKWGEVLRQTMTFVNGTVISLH